MLDYYYLQLLMWWERLLGSGFAAAAIYGVICAAVVAGGYAFFVSLREQERVNQMKTRPYRYFRLRGGRERERR